MRVLRDSFLYIAGEILSKSIPFLLLPYMTRKLGVEGYGELSFYQTIMALFLIVISLSQDGAVARYYYFYGKRSLNLIVRTGYAYNLIVSSIILIVCILLKSTILIYILFACVFQSFISVQLSVRQCQKLIKSYLFVQLLSSFLGVFMTVLILELSSENLVEKRFLAMFIAYAITFFISYKSYTKLVNTERTYSFKSYTIAFKYLLFFGLPLLLHSLSFFAKGQLDKIFIYSTYSKSELGIYSAGLQIALTLSILLLATNKAVVPYYYESMKKKTLTINRLLRYFFISFLLVPIPAILAFLLPDSIYLWLLGEDYSGVKYYIVLFLVGGALQLPYLILVNYFFYTGKNLLVSTASIISTICYVLTLIITTQMGVQYIPYSMILANASILIILFFFILKERHTLKDTL